MRVLITGITGMVGSHLAEYVLRHHPTVEVHGMLRWRSPLDNIRGITPRVALHHAELRDLNSLVGLLRKVKPDRIFHLAAQSYVTTSFDAPADTLHTNVIGTTNLLDAVRIAGIDPMIHICSSSEVYGQVTKDEVPIRETNPLRPASPYAVSKVGEDMIALQYFLSYRVKAVRTRMFTHTGPRRGDVFAESAFAKQIAEIEAGVRSNPMHVGNLDSVRTFADVRDAVRAYWLLLEKCPPGEVYNIGGNRTLTVGQMLEILKGMARCKIEHVVDPALLRPSDVTLQIPDTTKFSKATGWEPQIPLEDTLRDLLDYHREKIRTEGRGSHVIISKTPFRISFFGGGTDYPSWYRKEGGAVLSTTINKYCYISCRYLPPFFGEKHRIVWSHIETVSAFQDILHPAVREGMRYLGFDDKRGLEIHHQGDLPARAGMGSSSSFAVGLIKALTALRGQMIGKHELALKAIELEQEVLKENVGSQDQFASAYGGLNLIHFGMSGNVQVEPVTIPAARLAELEAHLMLIYLGASRHASRIAADVIGNLQAKRDELLQMRQFVDQALKVLSDGKGLESFGRLLHKAWLLKRELSPAVSSPLVDRMYQAALDNGALGGKLLGAGGTGFMVFFVTPEKREALQKALAPYLHVPFKFETDGSSLIYYGPNDVEACVE